MKLFTKIAMGLAGFFLCVAAISFVVAASMGVRIVDVKNMIANGVFTFTPENGLFIEILDGDEKDWNKSTTEKEISHVCTQLNVKLGAGNIEIYYDDVSNVQIKQKNIPGFAITSSEVDGTVFVEGDMNAFDSSNASLTIVLPEDVELEAIYLEIGACKMEISDIITEKFTCLVGAGQAIVSNVSATKCNLEVGAGEAVVKNLLVDNLEVTAGVGEVEIEIAGNEAEYIYTVECGIGEVVIGDKSFEGLGAEQQITNMDATKEMYIECGIGEVSVSFTK